MEPIKFEYTKYEDSDEYRTCEKCDMFAPVTCFVPVRSMSLLSKYWCSVCYNTEVGNDMNGLSYGEQKIIRIIAQVANVVLDEITQRQQKAGVEDASF